MTIRTKLLLIESLSQEEGKFLGIVDFPMNPLGLGPFMIDGVPFIPVLGGWEIDLANTDTPEVRLVLRIMTKENADAAAKTMKLMEGAGAMRQGASGPVLDLNALRRGGN